MNKCVKNEHLLKLCLYKGKKAYDQRYPSNTHTMPQFQIDAQDEDTHPSAFICPITLDLMDDPVFTDDGHTCEQPQHP